MNADTLIGRVSNAVTPASANVSHPLSEYQPCTSCGDEPAALVGETVFDQDAAVEIFDVHIHA
jgi:hypothetical protein